MRLYQYLLIVGKRKINVDQGHIKTYVYSVKYNCMVDCLESSIQYVMHIQVDNII